MFARSTSVPLRSLTTVLSAPPSASRSTRSTSLVSMVMLPRSRKKRRRLPLAEKSKFSLPPEPLNRSVSVPPWPSTVSLPSPGSQTNVSWPVPRMPTSAAAVAVDAVVLRPAEECVGTVAAVERVVAVAAEQLELEQSREAVRTRDRVRAVKAVDGERLHAGHVHEGRDVRGGHPRVAGHRRRGDVDDIPRRGAEQPHEVAAALPVDREQVAPLLGPPDAHVGGEAVDRDRTGPTR